MLNYFFQSSVWARSRQPSSLGANLKADSAVEIFSEPLPVARPFPFGQRTRQVGRTPTLSPQPESGAGLLPPGPAFVQHRRHPTPRPPDAGQPTPVSRASRRGVPDGAPRAGARQPCLRPQPRQASRKMPPPAARVHTARAGAAVPPPTPCVRGARRRRPLGPRRPRRRGVAPRVARRPAARHPRCPRLADASGVASWWGW